MFDENMQIRDGDDLYSMVMCVHGNERLTMVFQFWLAELARDILRLGVFFRAAGIMLQVPSGGRLTWMEDEETTELVRESDRNTLCNVVAEALDTMGYKHLMDDIHELEFTAGELAEEWKELLERRTGQRHGLQNVIAECLDELLVKPGLAEIEQADEPHWWQRWRPEAE